MSSSSSSSYICHGVGPLVDPFRSHVSRSLLKGLPCHHHHHHHHISVMELGHLLTCSGLTYPEVSSKVYHVIIIIIITIICHGVGSLVGLFRSHVSRSLLKGLPCHHHHHHISVMELGHLSTRSGLTYPEVSSKVYHVIIIIIIIIYLSWSWATC